MLLTVFTPAYNRANTLPRLYESLLGQSCFDFEWLIIDDGSADDTPAVAAGFTGEGKFPVRYAQKENGGKHTAHNLALQMAAGDWFVCVDSDDLLAPGAVEAILAAGGSHSGIIAYKEDLEGNRLSGEFPQAAAVESLWQLESKYGCHGEFTLAFRTDFARKFPFPVFEGERFVTESVVYDRMAGSFALLPETVTRCEYQPDGYSADTNRLMKNNPNGYCLYFLQRIELAENFAQRVATAGKYRCFRAICKNKDLAYRGNHRLAAALGALAAPVFRGYYKFFRGIG